MPALSLDHWNIYCKDLDATVRFYERYVGLKNGDRPPFMFPGAWMYAGDKAILHIVSETDRKDHGSGAIDHVAINCSDIRGTIDTIKKDGVPYEVRKVPARNYRFNIVYSYVTHVLFNLMAPIVAFAMALAARQLGNGWIDLRSLGFDGIGGALFAMMVAAVIFDFFFYWMHRFEHHNKVLWQEHVLHHSDEVMSVTSAARTHFLDVLLVPAFVSLPMAILFKLPPQTIAVLAVVYVWSKDPDRRARAWSLLKLLLGR